MTAKTGAVTPIGAKIGSTFGTAGTMTTGDKLVVESFEHKANTEMLTSNSIGSGEDMTDSVDTGISKPSISIEKQDRYNDAGTALEALLFGGNSVMNMGSGAYCHSFLYEAVRNQRFATLALEECVGSVVEYASCTPTKLSVKAEPGNYVSTSIDLIGDAQKVAATTNNTASMAAATVADTKKIICKVTDKFRINAQAGAALSDSDVVNITGATIEFDVPAEVVPEIKNSAGNGQPRLSGQPPFSATITVTFRNESDFTWRNAFAAGTEYKADFSITGDLIGGSQYYLKQYCFPRLKLMEEPAIPLSSAAENPLTVVFKALVASTNPTGMIDNTPYVRVINTKATQYLA